MSVATFNEFVKTIDLASPGFVELARNVTQPSDLAAYAQKNGIELTAEEAAQVIETAKRQLEVAGIGPLTEDQLENVNGGSFLGILAAVGATVGLVGAAIVFAPAVVAAGAVSGFIAGATAVSTVAGFGLGAMAGGAIDLIKGD